MVPKLVFSYRCCQGTYWIELYFDAIFIFFSPRRPPRCCSMMIIPARELEHIRWRHLIISILFVPLSLSATLLRSISHRIYVKLKCAQIAYSHVLANDAFVRLSVSFAIILPGNVYVSLSYTICINFMRDLNFLVVLSNFGIEIWPTNAQHLEHVRQQPIRIETNQAAGNEFVAQFNDDFVAIFQTAFGRFYFVFVAS